MLFPLHGNPDDVLKSLFSKNTEKDKDAALIFSTCYDNQRHLGTLFSSFLFTFRRKANCGISTSNLGMTVDIGILLL